MFSWPARQRNTRSGQGSRSSAEQLSFNAILTTPDVGGKLKSRNISPRIKINTSGESWDLQTPPGPWVARTPDGEKKFGLADDHEPSDGVRIFSFHEAVDAMRKMMRQQEGEEKPAKPVTLDEALTAYGSDLKERGASSYNAEHPRRHLSPRLLAKPIALITKAELEAWRKGLIDKGMTPVTFNRLRSSLRAALELAAGHRSAVWKKGLARLGTHDTQESDNVVLSDAEVMALVRAAYHHNHGLGLLCDVLALTGARPSQAVRLQVKDLRADPLKPRLDMPCSGKGGGRDRAEKKKKRYAVSITPALASKLSVAAKGRSGNALLLLRSTGEPWVAKNVYDLYRRDVREVVAGIGLDPNRVTLYALRHSSITRMLLKNVPVRIIAAAHDTSISMIEKHYSVDIHEHSDAWTRSALLRRLQSTVWDSPRVRLPCARPRRPKGCHGLPNTEDQCCVAMAARSAAAAGLADHATAIDATGLRHRKR